MDTNVIPDIRKQMPQLSGFVKKNQSPRTWVIMGYRAGENTQILALAEALGWRYEAKRLAYRSFDFMPGLLRWPSLAGINKQQSSPLQPPWPELIISAGMRNEPICRWIKQQTQGTARLVHIGRPWTRLEHFDLVITTPQYRLPACPNIQHNTTTLNRVTDHFLMETAASWESRLAHMPKPCVAVNIGGSSGPYTFGHRAAKRLARQASKLANSLGGSLLVSTSSRTPASPMKTFTATVSCPMEIHYWTSGATDNPYHAYLALSDSIIVTGDSIAMLSEACATQKPVYIFDLGAGQDAMQASGKTSQQKNDFRLSAVLYKQLMHLGPQRLTRDIRLVHQQLISSGRAAWLGQRFPNMETPSSSEDMQRSVKRVLSLFAK